MFLNDSALREKDVINVCDGRKVGFICDLLIDSDCGRITAIFVSERFFGFTAQKPPLKISWDKISCIGEDTVLVTLPKDFCPPCPPKEERKCRRGGKFLF